MKKNSIIFLKFFTIFSLSFEANAIENFETEISVVKKLSFSFKQNHNKSIFPEKFSLSFELEGKNYSFEFIRKSFILENFPKIFTIEGDKQLNEFKFKDQKKYCQYQEKNGNGYGNLLLKPDNDFIFYARVFPDKHSDEFFDILPNRQMKGDKHSIKKRSSNNLKEDKTNLTNYFAFYDDTTFSKAVSIKKLKNLKQNKRFIRNSKKKSPKFVDVEVLLITDHSIYEQHKQYIQKSDDSDIFQSILEYYSFSIDGVNQKFENSFENDPDLRIKIRLTSIIIIKDKINSQWTNSEVIKVDGFPKYKNKQVINRKALDLFAEFVTSLPENLPYDHAIGVFDKDLWNLNEAQTPSQRSGLLGAAYTRSICDYSFSIVEDFGGFSHIYTMAHELGHSLGANHDQSVPETESCPASEYFLMSPFISFNKIDNLQLFSECSIKQIKQFLLEDGEISKQTLCLTKMQSKIKFRKHQFFSLTGQFWNATEQCKMQFGQQATFCSRKTDSICNFLYCRRNDESDCEFLGPAVDGTYCDPDSVCVKGRCQNQKTKNSCIYGDDLIKPLEYGIGSSNLAVTCIEWFSIMHFHGKSVDYFCNKLDGAKICCESCARYKLLKCQDFDFNCPSYKFNCLAGDIGFKNGANARIENVCRRTCEKCDTSPLKCTNNVCMNGGRCINETNNNHSNRIFRFKCLCPNGFKGDLCEIKIPKLTKLNVQKGHRTKF